jgi:8-oxo-dGTP diphosphatase
MNHEKRLSRRVAVVARSAPWLVRVAHSGYKLLQPKFTVGVVGVVFNPAGEVLLAEHVFHPLYPWGLPGGWINAGEQPYDAVIREIREELSLEVEITTLLLSEINLPGHLDVAYLCTTAGKVGAISAELLSYGWFKLSSLPPLLLFHQRAIQTALEFRKLLER